MKSKRRDTISELGRSGRSASDITCKGSEHHHRSRIFAFHHRREFGWVASYYPGDLTIGYFVHDDFFSSTKIKTCPPRFLKWFRRSEHLSARTSCDRGCCGAFNN